MVPAQRHPAQHRHDPAGRGRVRLPPVPRLRRRPAGLHRPRAGPGDRRGTATPSGGSSSACTSGTPARSPRCPDPRRPGRAGPRAVTVTDLMTGQHDPRPPARRGPRRPRHPSRARRPSAAAVAARPRSPLTGCTSGPGPRRPGTGRLRRRPPPPARGRPRRHAGRTSTPRRRRALRPRRPTARPLVYVPNQLAAPSQVIDPQHLHGHRPYRTGRTRSTWCPSLGPEDAVGQQRRRATP